MPACRPTPGWCIPHTYVTCYLVIFSLLMQPRHFRCHTHIKRCILHCRVWCSAHTHCETWPQLCEKCVSHDCCLIGIHTSCSEGVPHMMCWFWPQCLFPCPDLLALLVLCVCVCVCVCMCCVCRKEWSFHCDYLTCILYTLTNTHTHTHRLVMVLLSVLPS